VPNQYSWSGVYLNKDLKESLVIAGWFDDQNPMVSTRYVGYVHINILEQLN
jgi:hypothetical protein